jgi:hypothetical protein
MTRGGLGGSVVLLMVLAGCRQQPATTSGSSPTTQKAEPVQCTRSTEELAEIGQRNRDRQPFTSAELHTLMEEPEHAPHIRLWRDQQSYYALLEVVEGIIQPEVGRLRKRDVRALLGDAHTYNDNARTLEYVGNRPALPYGTHAVIEFDERDIVRNVDWVSE